MTTYYFDSVLGNNALAGTSIALAKQDFNLFNGFTPVAGDTVLFKRGTTITLFAGANGAGKTLRGGSSDTLRIRYGAYGIASVPYSIWKYGSGATGNMILSAAARSYLDFEDMYFDMRSSDCRNSIYIASQGGVSAVGITVRRCFFQGSNSPTLHIGNGLGIIQEVASSTAYPSNIIVEDCEFFDNDGHGLIIIGGRNIAVRRNKFYRNGANDPNGGHGFSSRYNRTDALTGWAVFSGNVYRRAFTGGELDAYYVQSSAALYLRLRRTAGTATAPAAGEYGVSAGFLYVNLNGANPNSQSMRYAWGICAGLVIEENESYNNYWNTGAPFHEGHGFAFDDYADNSYFLRNKAYNNQGAGFSINRGDNNKVIGNIAYNNQQAAVVMSPMDNLNILHNTFYGNNTGTGAHTAEIFSYGNSKDAVISNNILIPTSAYGISRKTSDTGFTGTRNNITGATTAAEENSFLTGTDAIAPALDANYRPASTTLKRTGIYIAGKDFYGKPFYNPPNVGAVDDHPVSSWDAVTRTG